MIENARKESLILPASVPLVFADDSPVLLTARSGGGKSLYLRHRFLPHVEGPLFLIDPANEHSGLKRMDLGDFFQVKWEKADSRTKVKFCPSGNPDISKSELRTIFAHLNLLKQDGYDPRIIPSGPLSRWLFIAEEGHRMMGDRSFTSFLNESRKFVRKFLVLASDPTPFSSVCRMLKPELEGLLLEVRNKKAGEIPR